MSSDIRTSIPSHHFIYFIELQPARAIGKRAADYGKGVIRLIPTLPFTWQRTNDMLICSMATGARHCEMLDVMGPTLSFYASLHGMDAMLLPLQTRLVPSRPPAWDKVVLLYRMLELYETVMWIDCDSIICDPVPNIRNHIGDLPMYLAREDLDGVPNTGVWVLLGREAQSILLQIWNNTPFINHKWWEQSALMDLMGFTIKMDEWNPHVGLRFDRPTPLSQRIGHLSTRWNSCSSAITGETIIKHYCGIGDDARLTYMRQDYAQLFLNRIAQINR